MTATKIYTREDVRDLWRRYQHGDMAAGNDFAWLRMHKAKLPGTEAEIEPECREKTRSGLQSQHQSRAAETCRNMLWEKTEAYKQRQPGLSHKEAFRLVLLENPTLAEHYTGFSFRSNRD